MQNRLAGPKEGKVCYWTVLSTSAFLSKELSPAGSRSFRLSVAGTAASTRIEEAFSARSSAALASSPGLVDPRICCASPEASMESGSGDLGPNLCPEPLLRSWETRYPWLLILGSPRSRNCSRLCRELEAEVVTFLLRICRTI